MADIVIAPEEERLITETTQRIFQESAPHRGSLIPILQRVQGELGYLPRLAMSRVAEFLDIPPVDVYSVATFYNQFRLSPPGKRQIKVCLGTACHTKGGQIILECWKRRLGIDAGETTPDREFSLDRVACVGACAMAPITVIDDEVQGKISPTRVDGLLLGFKMEKDKQQGSAEETTDES